MAKRGIRSMLLLPMVAQDRTLALVQVTESRRQRLFSEQEVLFAQLLANQAAPAIHSAITQAETERRLDKQMVLRRASTIISSTLDLQGVMSSVAEQMCRVVNGTSAYILHYDQRQSTSTIIAEYIGIPTTRISDEESGIIIYAPAVARFLPYPCVTVPRWSLTPRSGIVVPGVHSPLMKSLWSRPSANMPSSLTITPACTVSWNSRPVSWQR
jgi:hypothetical protein